MSKARLSNEEEWNGYDDDPVEPSNSIVLNSSPSFDAQLAPPCGVYESVEVAIREFNLWAEPLGYTVIRGRTKYRKTNHLRKPGLFVIGERSLSCVTASYVVLEVPFPGFCNASQSGLTAYGA